MAHKGVVAGGGRLTDQISIGVLAASVARDAVDDAVAVTGRQARRSDGKPPPHVMVYFAMTMALFADDDYEEVAARLAGTLSAWGCWGDSWSVPTYGGITQARQRLGAEPLRELFSQVAVPVADQLTRGGVPRRLADDGRRRVRLGCPDSPENAEAFGYAGGGTDRAAFPKVRVVTLSEGASHAVADAEIGAIGGQGQRRAGLGPRLYACLEEDWLLIADRGFYSFDGWNTAAAAGGALLWRVKADLLLPVLELLPDGSYSSVLFRAGLHDKARAILTAAARAGENLDGDKAVAVRSFPPVLAVHLLSGFAPTAGSEPLACWPSPSIRPLQAAERHSSADGEEGQPPDGGVAVDG